MKEHSIIFSTEMVKAILDGRKTQTRRIIKPQPTPIPDEYEWKNRTSGFWWPFNAAKSMVATNEMCGGMSPYGQVGDLLWVRETFWYCCEGCKIPYYRADGEITREEEIYIGGLCLKRAPIKWKPSIHMPKWAARIWLELTNIRIERLQNISREDAIAEGIDQYDSDITLSKNNLQGGCMEIDKFAILWDSLNAKRGFGWDANPWVWVIEFKKVKG